MGKVIHRKEHFPLFFVMLSAFFILMLVANNVQAQSGNKISITCNNEPLPSVLKKIEKASVFKLLFTYDEVQNYRVTVSLKERSIDYIMQAVLRNTPFHYTIKGKFINVSLKKTEIDNTNKNINGRVISEEGEPLIGATIIINYNNGKPVYLQSNGDGSFKFKSNGNEKSISVNYIGYKSLTLSVNQNKDSYTFKLSEDTHNLDEVIVNGFTSRKKEGFAGAVTTIKKADLEKVHTSNIFTTINALDAGFKINENNNAGSSPNSLPDFTIRGKGSFQTGSTQPLFILDGFETSLEKIYDLDVNRIESITLLKDASATILYGSRAANGVVVIETTTPKAGKIRVNYDFKPTLSFADLSDYDLMNAKEKLQYEKLAGLYDATGDLSSDYTKQEAYYLRYKNVQEGVDTYWLKQPVRNALSQAHSLYIDGGVNELRYGIDASYNKTNGIVKESGRDRYNFGIKLIYRIKNKVTVQNYASYSYTHAYNSPFGSFSTYAKMNPYERVHDDKGEILPTLLDGTPNPLYDAKLPNRDYSNYQTFIEQLNVDWAITDSWRFRAQFSYTKGTNDTERYTSPFSSTYMYDSNGKSKNTPVAKRGYLYEGNGKSTDLSGNFTLNYNKMFFQKHLLYMSLGGEITESKNNSHGFSATGFVDDKYSDPGFAIQFQENTKPQSTESTTRSVGFFLNLNYIYDNRFFTDFSTRYDGSSNFGSDKKWAPFWSIGAGWNVHNEHFWSKESILNMLKLRFSYGVTGNQEFSAYQAKTMYKYQLDRLYNTLVAATLMGYGNPDLKWQTQHQTNIGLDLGLWKDRVNVIFNYYHKITKGMLTSVTVAPSIGLADNSFTSNLGKIQNNGYELVLNGALIQNVSKGLEWRCWLQMSHNKNVLKEISNQMKGINATNNVEKYIPGNVYEEGESMTAIKAVRSLGIDPATGKEIFQKKDGTLTYVWDADDKILCGDTEPKLYGNIGSNFYWNGWNLNAIFNYRLGADYYNQTLASRVEGANPSYNADRRVLHDRWTTPGQHALYKNIKDYGTSYISSRFVQKENYIKLTSISLSYDLKKSLLAKYKISNMRLSFYANDIFRASTIKTERGLDYPFERSYVFGLDITL
jgi:TonB-linked SusC/RagA family outer membrane protein